MNPSHSDLVGAADRRREARLGCHNLGTICQVTDVLYQSESPGRILNASTHGLCLLVEPHYENGQRLVTEFRDRDDGPLLRAFVEVVHTHLIPSQREQYITGCVVRGEPIASKALQRIRLG
jgi:hypothetical protein